MHSIIDKMPCDFCHEEVSTSYSIYRIIFKADNNFFEIGFMHLINDMNDWIFKKSYFLSPTEIILMRPDLLTEFLNETKREECGEIQHWFFSEYIICPNCYEEYKSSVPER